MTPILVSNGEYCIDYTDTRHAKTRNIDNMTISLDDEASDGLR